MATLVTPNESFTFDDRLLEHLKLVITQKLRRNEAFLLTWSYAADQGSGRRSIWIHSGAALHFRFSRATRSPLNGEWLQALLEASHSVRGLSLDDVPEPAAAGAAAAVDEGPVRSVSAGRRR